MKKSVIVLLITAFSMLFSQDFTDISAGLTGVDSGNADWGDFDNDGDLDVFVSGHTGSVYISKIYRNTNGVFTDINAGLTGAALGSSAWGDYDSDGDLDIIIAGTDGTVRTTKIYRNNNGVFSDINAGLTGVWCSSVAWGDYDNDGDLDILLNGVEGSTYYSIIYRNDNGSFTDISAGLQGVYNSSCTWIDYDKDADLDVFISGSSAAGDKSLIYRNDSGAFTNISAGLQGVHYSSADWGDYDSDGDPDLILTGSYNSVSYSIIYRNDAGIFTNIGAGLQVVWQGSADWGDYDNDGDLDVVLTGTNASVRYSNVYRNDNGVFTDINASLTTVSGGSSEWGDYDNDGDLDILITGSSGFGYKTIIYRNNSGVANTPPNVPTALLSSVTGYDALLSWNKTTDAQTLQNGLSYNVYISSEPGTCDTKSPMSNISTGFRKIVATGNTSQRRQWTIKGLSPGTYYWSVQAIDHAFAGSAFAAEGSFFTAPDAPVATEATNVTINGFRTNWNTVENSTGYKITIFDNVSFWEQYDTTNNWYDFSGLLPDSTYYYYVMAYNSSGSSPASNVITVNTLPYFTDTSAGLIIGIDNSIDLGDYDNDSDLDLAVSGFNGSTGVYTSKIYRNDLGSYTDINAGIAQIGSGSTEWGDYDHDGDLDLLMSGGNVNGHYTIIYRNDSGIFTDINAGLTGVCGSATWGDYDSDGDLDIAMNGLAYGTSVPVTKIYRNEGGVFIEIASGLPGIKFGVNSWCDYDNDGDLDLALIGQTNTVNTSAIYRNDSGVFTDISAVLIGLYNSSIAWGDYDNDGDQDLLCTGTSSTTPYSRIYRNDSGTFVYVNANLHGVRSGSAEWGDYDNDGDLDILISGSPGAYTPSTIYRNDSGIFTNMNSGFAALFSAKGIWGDIDNDNDLDILMIGQNGSSEYISKIYTNNISVKNSVPSEPSNLSYTVTGYDATLSWNKAADAQTSQDGLSYNLYISSEPGTCDTKSPMSDMSTGYRKIVSSGNAGQKISWTVKDLLPGTYYWSVQAVDNAFAGSSFAAENTFFTAPEAPFPVCTDTTSTSLSISWNSVPNASSYSIQFDDNSDFSSTIYNYSTSASYFNVSELETSTTYYFRVRSYNSSGYSSYSSVLTVTTKSAFTEIDPGITNVYNSSSDWGDFDSDGDIDLLLMGFTGSSYLTKIFRNDSGQFSAYANLTWGMSQGNSLWNDYDNDGDLDVIIAGMFGSSGMNMVYRNDSGVFNNTNMGFTFQNYPSFDAADFDNDGDTDFLMQGTNSTRLYRNNGLTFSSVSGSGFSFSGGYDNGTVDWCDYDNDGDMDVLITGSKTDPITIYSSKIYRNDSGVFTDIAAGLTGLSDSSADWGDYDMDGDFDIIITGYNNTSPYYYSVVYRNDSGVFTDISAGLTGVRYGSSEWGDFNNDNQPDILITGYTGTGYISKIYQNNYGTFSEVDAGLTGIYRGNASWGDYDNDDDLDIFVTGSDGSSALTKIYINNIGEKNSKPSKPVSLVTSAENDSLKLSFGSIYSDHSLSYNIEIVLNGDNITPSQGIQSTGYRKVVKRGSISKGRKYFIPGFDNLPQEEKSFNWKVQAVDNCFAGSEFASSNNFVLSSPRDLSLSVKSVMTETDLLKWEYAYSEFVNNYIIQLDEDPYFGSPIEQTYDPSIKSDGSKILYLSLALNELAGFGEMISNETYYYRVKPVYTKTNCVTIFSETPRSFLFNPTGTAPNPPVSGFNPANDDIESSLPKLSWNNAVDPDGHAEDLYYICQIDTVSSFINLQYSDTTAAGITSIQVATALPEGFRYYYRVKTIDADALQSVWSAAQSFIVVMPPQDVKITDDGTNVNLTWDAIPVNTKGVVYTVYSSENPYAEFPTGWTVSAAQLTSPSWSEPHSAAKKFYRITVGSSSK